MTVGADEGEGGGAAADMTLANASGGGPCEAVNPPTVAVYRPVQVAIWNATPMVPRPPCVPMTGPMSPMTISPG